jgi:NADH-quinone oxidoreductase subunit J
MTLYIFYFLSILAIFSGLMTIIAARNPIHSVIFLIICFFSIAGHYLLLNAQFLAVVHIIVYAGAIMVLFLFTLMLMNLNEETEKHKPAISRISAVIAACLLGLVMVAALRSADAGVSIPADNSIGTIQRLGYVLMNEYLFPFEFTSILLLSAMIGAVLLSKRERTPQPSSK